MVGQGGLEPPNGTVVYDSYPNDREYLSPESTNSPTAPIEILPDAIVKNKRAVCDVPECKSYRAGIVKSSDGRAGLGTGRVSLNGHRESAKPGVCQFRHPCVYRTSATSSPVRRGVVDPELNQFRVTIASATTTTITPIPDVIITGDITHHHDQSMTPVSFKAMNKIVSAPVNPSPEAELDESDITTSLNRRMCR